jgi:hypothetical protein
MAADVPNLLRRSNAFACEVNRVRSIPNHTITAHLGGAACRKKQRTLLQKPLVSRRVPLRFNCNRGLVPKESTFGFC